MARRIFVAFLSLGPFLLGPSYCVGQMHRGRFTDVRRVPGIDSPFQDWQPWVSEDGLRIFFSSDRFDPAGNFNAAKMDLWTASRDSTHNPFSNLTRLPDSMNREDEEAVFFLSPDETRIVFLSKREGLSFTENTFVARRDDRHDAWDPPETAPNQFASEFWSYWATTFSPDELTMYFTAQRDANDAGDLYQVTRTTDSEPFEAHRVESLTSINTQSHAENFQSVSADGRMIVFTSDDVVNGPAIRELWVATRDSTDEPFETPMPLNDFGAFTQAITGRVGSTFNPYISRDWPAPESKLYFSAASTFRNTDIYEATWHVLPLGDLTKDFETSVEDIAALDRAVRDRSSDLFFDLNEDGKVDQDDRSAWVHRGMGTFFGDANLDGIFDSGDLVAVLQAGEFEDELAMNSSWATGDWNGDAESDTGDLVLAFQDGGYELGRQGNVNQVPESSSVILLMVGLIGIAIRWRHVGP